MNTPNICPPRPSRMDDDVLKEAAIPLGKQVFEWSEEDEADQLQGYIDDIYTALKETYDLDGYKLSKYLEDRNHYSSDYALVNILNSASYCVLTALNIRIKKWIDDWGIKPELAVGTRVKFMDPRSKKTVIGTITKIYENNGTYSVNCPELGHINPEHKGITGTLGAIIPWEDKNIQAV